MAQALFNQIGHKTYPVLNVIAADKTKKTHLKPL